MTTCTTHRYEFESSKYWEISLKGSNTLISYGAVGAQPRPSNKEHKSVAEAQKFADKKIAEKIKKGYVLVNDDDNNNNKRRPLKNDSDDGASPPAKRVKKAAPASPVVDLTSDAPAMVNLTSEADAVDLTTSDNNKSSRRFECGATKFWEIAVEGSQTLISYGPMGQAGRPSNATHKDTETAEKFAAKKIKEKLKKGYKEVESSNSGTAPSANSATSNGGRTATGPLEDGDDREVEGSGMNPYIVSRRGDVFSCTCPGWRFQKKNIAVRSCKHIKEIQGEDVEAKRTGDSTTGASSSSSSSSLPFSSVMLANKYIEEKHATSLATGEWWMSEKLDGLRAVWDGTKFMSRAGNTFYAPEDFVKDFPTDVVLDGELFCGRGQFDVASGLVRSMGGTYEQWDGKVTYQIFDAPLLKSSFEERLEDLKQVAAGIKHAFLVEQEAVRNADHLAEKLASIEADDGEGVMLRKKGSAYEFKRSNVLLKVKSTHDAEAEVIGHEEGKGKNTGKLGALVCKLPSGKKFKVGTGLSDAERANPPAIGTTITFGYFELTKGGVPRFPTFKRVFVGH